MESADFSFDQQITPVQFDSLIRDDSEEDKPMQPALHKRGGYVSQSAVALRCRVMPPPCVKNPYLNTDPCIDDHVYGGRQCNSEGTILCYQNSSKVCTLTMHLRSMSLLRFLGCLIFNYCIFFLPQHNKNIDISIIIMNAQTDLNIFLCLLYKGFSPSIGGNGLSRYRTDFHEIEVYPEYNYMYVHVQAALIHFDGWFYSLM